MEITTLQQRIEERAKERLLKDLYDAAQKEASIANLVNALDGNVPNDLHVWQKKLSVRELYGGSYSKAGIIIENEYSQKIFDTLLPKYIAETTDELLNKIDEIDFFKNQDKNFEDLP